MHRTAESGTHLQANSEHALDEQATRQLHALTVKSKLIDNRNSCICACCVGKLVAQKIYLCWFAVSICMQNHNNNKVFRALITAALFCQMGKVGRLALAAALVGTSSLTTNCLSQNLHRPTSQFNRACQGQVGPWQFVATTLVHYDCRPLCLGINRRDTISYLAPRVDQVCHEVLP